MRYNANRSTSDNSNKTTPIKRALFLLIFVAIVGIAGYFITTKYYDKKLNEANSQNAATVEFTIQEGETPTQIFNSLVRANLINEDKELIYKFYLRQSGLGATIQAGKFRIPQNLSLIELVDTLQDAGIDDLWVTIPEGLRITEIAAILDKEYSEYDESVFSKEEFINITTNPTQEPDFIAQFDFLPVDLTTLEGYLFPDKYLLPIEATTKFVVTTLLNTYETKITGVTADLAYKDLIIASMIEREAKTEYDRRMVSDIMHRRLNEGWFLGIDATNLYYHGDWEYELTYQDLQLDHPYNTRTRIGLPPTPICNPGLSSINAALNPEPNDYYYYITGNDGNFYYAKTAAEHNQNIANYLR